MKNLFFMGSETLGINKLAKKLKTGATALFYHGVELDDEINDQRVQELHLPFSQFEKQIDYLRNNFEIISLDYLCENIRNGYRINSSQILLTFDDGYKSIVKIVAPYLRSFQIPFSVFICTNHIENGLRFPTYYLRATIFYTEQKYINVQSIDRKFDISTEEKRIYAKKTIEKFLKKSSQNVVDSIVKDLIELVPSDRWQEINSMFSSDEPMNWDDIKKLDNLGVTIGSHGHDHFIFNSKQSKGEVDYQLKTSKELIEKNLRKCKYFAFPDGRSENVRVDSLLSMREYNYYLGFTVVSGEINNKSNPFLLPRLGVSRNLDHFKFRINTSFRYNRQFHSWSSKFDNYLTSKKITHRSSHHSLAKLALGITRSERIKSLHALEQSQWQHAEEIRKIQLRKLKKLLEHAYVNVPYYRLIFDRLKLSPEDINALEDIRRLPLQSKNDIIISFSQIIAKNYKKHDLIPNSTGGSTGVKLKFFNDKKASNFTEAVALRKTRWSGWDIGEKQAYIWGSHHDISKAKSFSGKLKNSFIYRNLFLSSYDMTEENMLDYRKKIYRHRPELITGYVSALYLFSKFLDEKKLDIYTPKGIISSAETLHEHQRKKIESVFGCKVFNRYGCRESGLIAQECGEQMGMHICAEHMLVEVLDENGHPCEPGKRGEIIVTDLDNYAFPFIRYRIEDIGILSDNKCPCGRGLPLLRKVEGRIWDIIVGTNGNRLVGTFWLIEDVRGIKQFQILQEKFGEITLKLIVNNSFTEKEKQKLLYRIYQRCGKEMKVDIQIVKKIPLTKSGKHRFIISKVSPFI